FLAVTISLASIAFAGVLVQPGYEHQYDSNPRYLQHQSVSRHWIRSPTEQHRAEQLPDQESTRYLPGVQTTEKNEDPKEIIHNRRKRSDPASTESSKSKIVAHDNDVAAKSPLTDVKHSTTDTNDKRVKNCSTKYNIILSIFPFLGFTISSTNITLPEHESADTNDKRVKNCQTEKNFVLSILPFRNSNISYTGFPDRKREKAENIELRRKLAAITQLPPLPSSSAQSAQPALGAQSTSAPAALSIPITSSTTSIPINIDVPISIDVAGSITPQQAKPKRGQRAGRNRGRGGFRGRKFPRFPRFPRFPKFPRFPRFPIFPRFRGQ
ncbi:uncharacterized protein LOC112467595, partial [Temnothorax curvispinosus]|uniref:Uncharacterized protein LOC112467595 n=1 Tax=Temnothorax curvispinosus TaxID=300111 RepID=A0A6J1RBE3_9HYME